MARITIFRDNDGQPSWATVVGEVDDGDLGDLSRTVCGFIKDPDKTLFAVESCHDIEVR